MVDQFPQNHFPFIGSPESKLRTYALFKTEIGMEKYLVEMKTCELRTKYTKSRLSKHNLMIEKGWHMGLKPEERTYPFCPNVIEDEKHFFLDCQMYREIRAPLVREAERLNYFFKFLDREQKFKHFLIDFAWNSVADIIFKCFELRDFLLSFPKRHD